MLVSDYEDKGYIEGYAAACVDILGKLTGEKMSHKIYDPLTVNLADQIMRSYAFNMKDGGRSHPLSDYEDIEEVCDTLLQETFDVITQEYRDGDY